MNYYTTRFAKINAEMPQNTANMSARSIVEYARKHFKYNGDMEPANKFTAYMIAVSHAIFNPQNWKSPIYAIAPACGKDWAEAAIIWYHGEEPIRSFSGVYSNGYCHD